MLKQNKTMIKNPWFIVGAITLLGAFLRLYHLGFKPLWFDEAVMYWISNRTGIRNVIESNNASNGAPPVFVILLSYVIKINASEEALRLLPSLAGIAAIPAAFLLSKEFMGNLPACLTTLLVAIAPTQVSYSQEVREYSMAFLLAILILLFFYRYLNTERLRNLILLTLFMFAGLFVQYGLALLILSLNFVFLFWLLFLSKKDQKWKNVLQWSVSQFIIVMGVILVYFLSLKHQFVPSYGASGTSVQFRDAYWQGGINSFFNLVVGNTFEIIDFAFPGGFFIFLLIVGVVGLLLERKNDLTTLLFVSPFAIALVLGLARLYPYHGNRHMIFLTPMVYVVAGLGIRQLFINLNQKRIFSVLMIFPIASGLIGTQKFLSDPGKENIRPLVAALSENIQEGDKIYVYYAAQYAFDYYCKGDPAPIIYGSEHRGETDAYFLEIDQMILNDQPVWLVFSHCYGTECEDIIGYFDQHRDIEIFLEDNYVRLVYVE